MGFRHAAHRTGIAVLVAVSVLVMASDSHREQPSPAFHGYLMMFPAAAPAPLGPAPARDPNWSANDRRRLSRQIADHLEGRSGRVSMAVRDLVTGATYSYAGGVRTATASIVKVNVLAALLLRAQKMGRRLTASERSLAAAMIRSSDNDATSALWNEIGGASGLASANRRLGLKQTMPGSGGYWGSTTTSAVDQIRLLAALTSGNSPLTSANRRYIRKLMSEVDEGQAWGVSAAAAPGADVALKNGWLPRAVHGGAWTINSIGRVTGGGHDYLIAVISEGHPTMDAGVATVEKVTTLATRAISSRTVR